MYVTQRAGTVASLCGIRNVLLPFKIAGHLHIFSASKFKSTLKNTDMRRLTTGIRSDKRVVGRFRRCANVYLTQT